MRRSISVLTFVLSLGIAPNFAHAQIKLPVFDDQKGGTQNVVFEDASSAPDFQHGHLVRVTLNDGKAIRGTLVRTDASNDRIFVRTAPGQAPTEIAAGKIKKMEKGVIRQVDFRQDVTRFEIQQITIHNGLKKTIVYRGPDLSPPELAQLQEIESAENEVARLEYLNLLEEKIAENNLAVSLALRKRQELVTEMMWLQFQNYTGSSLYWANSLPFFTDPTVTLPPSEGTAAPRADALTAARRRVASLQSHAIYENGTLVAVLAKN